MTISSLRVPLSFFRDLLTVTVSPKVLFALPGLYLFKGVRRYSHLLDTYSSRSPSLFSPVYPLFLRFLETPFNPFHRPAPSELALYFDQTHLRPPSRTWAPTASRELLREPFLYEKDVPQLDDIWPPLLITSPLKLSPALVPLISFLSHSEGSVRNELRKSSALFDL